MILIGRRLNEYKRDSEARQLMLKARRRGIFLRRLIDLTFKRDLVCPPKQSGCPEWPSQNDFMEGAPTETGGILIDYCPSVIGPKLPKGRGEISVARQAA